MFQRPRGARLHPRLRFPLGGALPPALRHRPAGGAAELRPAAARSPGAWATATARADGDNTPAVERFMRRYFLIAREVGALTRVFCAKLEAEQAKTAPRGPLALPAGPPRRAARPLDEPGFHDRRRPADRRRAGDLRGRSGQSDPAVRASPTGATSTCTRTPSPPPPARCSLITLEGAPRSGGRARSSSTCWRAASNPQRTLDADERGRRARPLHPRVRPHRRADAVQHVPLLHGGRAHAAGGRRDRRHRRRRASPRTTRCRSPSCR